MHHVTINQKNQKKGRQKEGNRPPRKLSPKKCLQKNKKQKKSPKCLQKNRKQQIPPCPLKPIYSLKIGWEHGADVAARKEGAHVDWGLGGHGGDQHEDEVGCGNMPSGVGRQP